MHQRVMFLCDYQAPYGGNFVPTLMELEERLAKTDVEVVYVFAERAIQYQWFQELKVRGKKLELCAFNKGKMHILKEIRRLVTMHNISILHSHFVSISTVELFSIIEPTVKVIIHVHSDFSGGRYTWKLRFRDYLLYRVLSQNVVFLSVVPYLVKKNPNKIKYLPNALSANRIICNCKNGEKTRQLLGVQQDEILIEIFGWSPYIKGVDVAVNAVKAINEQGKNIKLAIVCGIEMTPQKMQEWINKNTDCTGKESFLRYLDPTEDVFSYHKAADILLSASRSEGFSYSILEMLSIGKHCVASDILGVSWAKKYSIVEWFEVDNVSACVSAILCTTEALSKNDLRTAKMIEKDFAIKDWTDRILKEYGLLE